MSKMLNLLKRAKKINKMENFDDKLYALFLLNCYLPEEFSHLDELVSKDGICHRIVEEAVQGNLQSVANLLKGVTDFSKEYYLVDGYGYYNDLDESEVKAMLEDIIKTLSDECAEEIEWERARNTL